MSGSSDDPAQVATERIGGALTDAGMARVPSRLFTALLLDEDGRMTAAELGEFLHVSPASVSGAVRYLTGLGMVRRERERGSRRDVYVVDDDAWYQMMVHSDRIYAPIRAALRQGRDLVGEGTPGHTRLTLALEFLVFLQGELEGVNQRWETRKKELGLDG